MEAPKRKVICQRVKNKLKKLNPGKRHKGNSKKSNMYDTSIGESSIPPPLPMSDVSEGIPQDNEAPSAGNSVSEKIVGLPDCQEIEGASASEEVEEVFPTTVDLSSTSEEKLLKDMSWEGHHQLVILLQPLCTLGNDYRLLASKMGYKYEYIKYLGSLQEPVKELIMEYEKKGRTIAELVSLLKQIGRPDVVHKLQEYIETTPTPREIEERVQSSKTCDELKTVRDSYDAFVCFAEKDQAFVDKLVKITEGEPHRLNLCLPVRDFLPGGSRFETTAVAIEQRCSKFIVVLSTNFDGSSGASYEAHIAMSLAPGVKEKRIIPVLIDEAYRYNIPRTISHITYLDYIRQSEDNFWELLCYSLTCDY